MKLYFKLSVFSISLLFVTIKSYGQKNIDYLIDRRINSFDIWTQTELINGHPFLTDDWQLAEITTPNGVYEDIPVKLNIEQNEIYYRDKEGTVQVLMDDQVTSLEWRDAISFNLRKFIRIPLNGYFEVIESGNISLLIKYKKVLVSSSRSESVSSVHSRIPQHYTKKTIFTLWMHDQLYEVKSNKELKDLFNSDHEALKFIKEQKVRISNTSSVNNFVKFLNGKE